MTAISVDEFLTNPLKYLDFSMSRPFAIVNELGQMLKISKPRPARGREATPEEIELFRRGEENLKNGNYYAQRDGETVREFTERILMEDN